MSADDGARITYAVAADVCVISQHGAHFAKAGCKGIAVSFDHHIGLIGFDIGGDGAGAHMGAGAITSNIKADKTNVVVKGNGYALATGFRKMGAMLGDYTDIGCNSVCNPGTIVGRHTNVYPLSMLRGVIPADSIYKGKNEIVAKKKTFD